MEAYKKLKARKSKHTHIKPPKSKKKKPAAAAAVGREKQAEEDDDVMIGEDGGEIEGEQRKVYRRRRIASNAYRYELEEASARGSDTAERQSAPSLKELLENAGTLCGWPWLRLMTYCSMHW